MRKKVVVVLSGGQDSTTCLFLAKQLGYELHAVTFDYEQRHRQEIRAACIVAEMAGVESHEIIYLGPVLKGTSPLISKAKLEQYSSYDALPGGLEKTFVPMRNQMFLTIAANRAFVLDAYILFTGVSAEDFGGYPDCRQPFIDSLAEASSLGTFTEHSLHIWAPLMRITKAATVKMALDIPECYEALAYTHTAYDGRYPPTGKDHASLLRNKGFEQAGIPDPLILRAYIEGRMDLPQTANYSDCDDWIYRIQEAIDVHG